MRTTLVLFLALSLPACGFSRMETVEPWHDQLAGSLLPEEECPLPASNGGGATQSLFEDKLSAVSIRFETALHSDESLAQEVLGEDLAGIEMFFLEAMGAESDVRIVFWPKCFEDSGQRVFETTAYFQKIGSRNYGIDRIELHFRRYGYKSAPSLRWNSTTFYRY